MMRRHVFDDVKGKKLEPHWFGPLKVLRFAVSGNSVWVNDMHGAVKERRYHVDDVKVYVRREQGGDAQHNKIAYERAFLKCGGMVDSELSLVRDGVPFEKGDGA